MTTTLNNFSTAVQLTAIAPDVAVSVSGEKKYIGQFTLTNTSAASVEVTVYKIDTSETETSGSGGNWLTKRTIQPSKVWNVLVDVGNLVLDGAQTLSAVAGTGAVINAECSGTVES